MRVFFTFMLFSTLAASNVRAEVAVYSMHIGVNTPPSGYELPRLHYADDDAARFYSFFSPMARRSILATVLDADSQRRFSDLAEKCLVPTEENLNRALKKMADEMAADRKDGKKVVFYFSYSGHGVRDQDGTFLALFGGGLRGQWLESQVMNLPADFIHIFIDACHSQGVLESRGVISKEASASSRKLTDRERTPVFNLDLLERFPNVGAMLAATSDSESHEWSRLQSGVFTHEVLSAIAGAADVNNDGAVSYSEVAAFIASANRFIKDPRASIGFVYEPPAIDRNTPLVSLVWFLDPAFLEGIPAGLGHFYLETDDGIRLVDAHPAPRSNIRILLPVHKRIWVRSGDIEASFQSRPDEVTSFASLEYRKADSFASRGSISDAFRKGFFAAAFGVDYYLGYVDQKGETGVPFRTPLQVHEFSESQSKIPAAACLVTSGVSLGSTVLFAYLAWDAKKDFDATNFQKPAQEAKDRMVLYQALAIGSGLVTAGLAVVSWLLWPERSLSIGPGPGGMDSAGLSFGFAF